MGHGFAEVTQPCCLDEARTIVKRIVPHLLWIAGLLLLIGAAFDLYALSFSYTDPSFEILALRSRSRWGASFVVAVAALFIIFGLRRVRGQRRSQNTSINAPI